MENKEELAKLITLEMVIHLLWY